MAKGVPILGKDPLGKAKYANVTESGDLRVQLSGTIVEIVYSSNGRKDIQPQTNFDIWLDLRHVRDINVISTKWVGTADSTFTLTWGNSPNTFISNSRFNVVTLNDAETQHFRSNVIPVESPYARLRIANNTQDVAGVNFIVVGRK